MSYTALGGCTGGPLLCKVTDALNRSLTFTYAGTHLTQIQDFTGRVYQHAYDANGNLASFKNPLAVSGSQNAITYSYYTATDGPTLDHLLKQYTLPRGNGMKFDYYANGRTFRHTVVDTGGSLSPDQINTFTYNDFRRETVQTNERGYARRFYFDADGNPLKIVEENGAEYVYAYTQTGQPFNRTASTDPLGMRTQYAYDASGNVTTVTEIQATGSGQTSRVTTTTYDELNGPTRRVGPPYSDAAYGAVCPVTKYTYDSLGRLTQIAAGRTPSPCATPASDVTAVQETRSYDDYGRQIKTTDALGRTEQGGRLTTYTRNGLGQVSFVSHPEVSYAYGYNYDHRLSTQSDSRGGKTLTYTWSPGGGLNSLTDGDGHLTNYLYDPVGRLAAITAPNNDTVTFRFDASGRLTSLVGWARILCPRGLNDAT